MKKIILTFLSALLLTGCNSEDSKTSLNPNDSEKFKPFEIGEKITLKSIVDTQITLVRTEKGFKIDGSDKVLMIDIFGTYCEPCKAEAPHLMDFQIRNSQNFMLVGLIHFENITNQDVVENFSKKYNAYYFISNSDQNDRIIKQILKDINYRHALAIPFKVVFKDGKYQMLTDIAERSNAGKPYYLGAVFVSTIEKDFARITNVN